MYTYMLQYSDPVHATIVQLHGMDQDDIQTSCRLIKPTVCTNILLKVNGIIHKPNRDDVQHS